MYKFNNTGKDIMREATDKYAFGYRPPEVQPLTSGISIAQPSLEHERTSFNTSNMLATNWLVKTRHGHDLRMQLTAMHDRSAMSAYSETLHTDIDGNAMVGLYLIQEHREGIVCITYGQRGAHQRRNAV